MFRQNEKTNPYPPWACSIDDPNSVDDPQATSEADRLIDVIDKQREALFAMTVGQSLQAGSLCFEHRAANRNLIFYIKGKRRWYLKMSRGGNISMVEREYAGALAVKNTIALDPRYRAPKTIRVSFAGRFVLISEVPGGFLHSALYRSCVSLRRKSWQQVAMCFDAIGELLAIVHRDTATGGLPVSTAKPAAEQLNLALKKVSLEDSLCKTIRTWSNTISHAGDDCFIHGNLRRENIVLSDNRLCLIDYETCGSGTRYDDLSMVIANLALSKSVYCFPWKRILSCATSFLTGYRRAHPYDRDVLLQYITLRIANEYAWKLGGKRITIARIPVSKRCLGKMLLLLLSGDVDNALPGLVL